jgi:trigger factor
VPADSIGKIDERLQKPSRTVRLKGFRPGKVPVKVVQQFGQQVRQEVLGDVMQSTFAEAVTQEKLVPAAGPRIEPINLEQGGDLKYRAVFEVLPQIKLAGVESIEVIRPTADVTPADVDAMIQNLREQRPTYTAVEREAKDTDRVVVDFAGKLDGAPFEGGQGENVSIILGAGRMLADFEKGVRGARAGETKTVDVAFPANYGAANLAGKTAQFEITVKSVEERKLPELDDEFCKIYGVESGGTERLREEVEDNMRRELSDAVRARVKKQIMDALLTANPLELPKSLVDSQVRDLQSMPTPYGRADVFAAASRRLALKTASVALSCDRSHDGRAEGRSIVSRFEELATQLDPNRHRRSANPRLTPAKPAYRRSGCRLRSNAPKLASNRRLSGN